MTRADAAAAILWIGVTLYAVFGGADFGAGLWDLVAGGAERGERPRALIPSVLTPVWEANHVWLIFCLVVLWTGFPQAFGAVMSTLYVPLALAALGIVLRGAGFAFRQVTAFAQACSRFSRAAISGLSSAIDLSMERFAILRFDSAMLRAVALNHLRPSGESALIWAGLTT